ncbi:MAG: glutamate--tRNA ligase [Candidatus Parcubacteria bacterium]|nr:glutamate--tRNA ligase [Candidatus Parcubacteria bacterium]
MTNIKTRFAPSPTGYLHVGGLRTALYNFLFARHNQGKFLLRIEDTDQARLVKSADKEIFKILKEFGLKYDNKPVYQSKRLKIYQKFADQLIKDGKAYYCFCSPEKLAKLRAEQIQQKRAPKYDKTCCKLSPANIDKNLKAKISYVIRLNVPPNKEIKWNDIIRGEVKFNSNDIDDQVLLKSDGFPTYHLANVVDDHEMEITHVIRGEEWISSTPKHLLLYEYFSWTVPQFAHLPLLLNPDKSKLSKRQGDVAVSDYLAQGYLKDALINFLATIGWTEGAGSEQEIYSLKELIAKFDLKRINISGAIFNLEKLDWINGYYIRKMKVKELTKLCLPYLKDINPKLAEKIVAVEQERLKKLSDINQNTEFFYKEPIYKPELLIWKKSNKESTLENLVKLEDFIITLKDKDFSEIKTLEAKIMAWLKKEGYGVGDMLWPMRVALSGQQNSPSPFEIAWVLGKKETLKRINQAQIKLK